jgi:hypothetical protein
MKITTNNAMMALKNIVTDGTSSATKGFVKTAEGVSLATIKPTNPGTGLQQISFPANLAAGPPAGTSAADMVTAFVPGYRFELVALDFVTSIAGTGAGASQVYNLEIGTTNVTGGTCTVTLASTSAVGELTAGAAITALATGSATDTISIEQAASGTAFTAGQGSFVVTLRNLDVADSLAATADETNALVQKIDAAVDTVGNVVWAVPRDFDEGAQDVVLRVLASMVTVSTDTDVELDLEVYHKVPGTALSADRNPTAPGTVLAAAEAWVEFDLSTIFATNNINRDDVITMEIISSHPRRAVGVPFDSS